MLTRAWPWSSEVLSDLQQVGNALVTTYKGTMDGPLHHWLLEKLSRELAEEYERIQGELQGQPQYIQLSGYLAEAVWARLLQDWLPPQYEFGFRRHLLFEQPVDGKSRSPEIDLVLFHPSYPKRLRDGHQGFVLTSARASSGS
jgi:hypothetical protein